jgi:nucleotide-binding universal stress UspA family protein
LAVIAFVVYLRSSAMSFATLLVHVESEPTPDPRLALAIDLANQFDAKLIGVGAEFYRTVYYGGEGFDYSIVYLIAAEMDSVEADLKRAGEKFRSAAAAVRQGWDWRAAVKFPLAEIAAEARATDLVVTSRSGRRGASDYDVALPGALILQTGRPILVAPPDAVQLKVASVVVAWKDTREARRAVSDALPFLKRAQKVHLLEICDSKDASPAATTRLADVADHLLRHGVNATVSVDVHEKDATAAHHLLDVAERHNADLIVAGAYGHSRFQEWVFGGFTRALLAQTARAVLFSH